MACEAAGEPPLVLDASVQSSRFHSVAGAALQLHGLCLSVGSGASRRELLTDADLSLSPGSRVALVGRNGSGKSLLLRVLASGALFDPDAQLRLRTQLVTQSFAPPPREGWTVADEVGVPPFGCDLRATLAEGARAARRGNLRSGRRGRAARVAAVAAAAAESGGDECGESDEAFPEAASSYEAPNTADTLAALRALHIPISMLTRPWASLSGGWRSAFRRASRERGLNSLHPFSYSRLTHALAVRVVLAKAVLYQPSLLLLDEPTNHLDIGGINQLVSLLLSHRFAETTVVFVTHDLHFINALAQACLQLQDGKLTLAAGNWDALQRARAERKAFSERHAAEQEKSRERLLSSIESSLRSAAGRDDKAAKQLASRRDKALQRDVGLMADSKGHRWRRNAAENAGHHATLS